MTAHDMIAAFNLLGAIEVWSGTTRISLGGAKTTRVLAVLVLEAGRVVPIDHLIRVLWDEDPPVTAVHQVRKSIAELRTRIPASAARFETDGHGYRMELVSAQVDVHLFEARLEQARSAAEAGANEQVALHLRAALGIWRGAALAGLGGAVLEASATALEEQRLSAEEWIAEMRLAQGKGSLIVPRLRMLVSRWPLRESLRRLLMTALYQSGRKAEALEEYGRVRELLAEELGVDPGTELSQLYTAILRDSVEFEAAQAPRPVPGPPGAGPEPARAAAPAAPPAARSDPAPAEARDAPSASPASLPYDLDDFTGRLGELRMLAACIHASDVAHHLVAIDGMGGSGKTALAVHAAHRLAHLFPDGQLYVDLHGFTAGCEPLRPEAVLELLLCNLGVSTAAANPADGLEGRSAAWRTACTTRKLLIVLDNALDEAQVVPLLPAAPGCLVIVTSRRRMVNLDGAQQLSLDRLSTAEGFTMVERIIGTERAATEPEAVTELVRRCGGLPLALRIAAARLRHRKQWTVGHLVGRLSNGPEHLEELSSGDRSVADSLRLSFLALGNKQRRAFRLLGVHPGPDIDVYAAAELLGCALTVADRLLEGLLDVNLLEQHELGRFSLHDLVRDFARGLAEASKEDRLAFDQLLNYYSAAAEQAADLLFPGRISYRIDVVDKDPRLPPLGSTEEALAWFDRERANLTAMVRTAAQVGHHRLAAYIPRNLGAYLTLKEFPDELLEMSETSVSSARFSADPQLLRVSLTNAGLGHWLLGRCNEAIKLMDEALQLAVEIGDTHGQAACLSRLGSFHNSLGQPVQALRFLRYALTLQQELCDLREEAMAHNGVSATLNVLCRHEEAAAEALAAFDLNRRLGFLDGQALAKLNEAEALLGTGDWEWALERLSLARDAYERLNHVSLATLVSAWQAYGLMRSGLAEQALDTAERTSRLARDTGSLARRAAIGNLLGWVYVSAGRHRQAEEQYHQAVLNARAVGDRFELALAFAGSAAVSRARGGDAQAAAYAEQAARLFESVGTPMCCRGLPL